MKGRLFNDLQSYEKTIEIAKSFQFCVYFKTNPSNMTGGVTVSSSAMPIEVLESALEDLRLVDEGLALPIWDRKGGRLTIIPATEIMKVDIVFLDEAGPVVVSKD